MRVTLHSNSGRDHFVIDPNAPAAYACDPGFMCSILLCGQHWDGDHSFPFSLALEGIWLRSADLTALRDHISKWIRQPLDRLVAEELIQDFRLTRLPGQNLQLRFGPRSDTLSDRHPVISISFSAGKLEGEFHYVTDQSCLNLFAQELSTALDGEAP